MKLITNSSELLLPKIRHSEVCQNNSLFHFDERALSSKLNTIKVFLEFAVVYSSFSFPWEALLQQCLHSYLNHAD